MQSNYWDRLINRRLSRRRALLAAGALGVGAAAIGLTGCGDDDDSTGGSETGGTSSTTGSSSGAGTGSGGETSSGLLFTPEDSRARAKKGGDLPLVGTLRGFDIRRSARENLAASPMYSRLIKYGIAPYGDPAPTHIDGDVATEWEISPDKLTYTFKLRQGMKFDPRPPTNGKTLTAEDVAYSWKLYESEMTSRDVLAHSVNPEAPIESITTPDDHTAVFKLAYPYAPLLPMLGFIYGIFIVPTDGAETVELNADIRASGAWRLKLNEIDVKYVLEKNTDWYAADEINLDTITYNIVPEYASQLAQLRAGSIATMEVREADVIPTKKDVPELLMIEHPRFDARPFLMQFGYIEGSPFRKDERVRKALSMITDRDLYAQAFGNMEKLRAEGLDAKSAWNTCFGAGAHYWLDPQSTEFGESGRWYQYDPAEAKKLMEAAGYTSALKQDFVFSSDSNPDSLEYRSNQALAEMWNSTGLFDFTLKQVDHISVFRPDYNWNYGQFEGFVIASGGAEYPDPDNDIMENYKSGAAKAGYVEPDGSLDQVIEDLIWKQREELDPDVRLSYLHDFQRRYAERMWGFNQPAMWSQYALAQPWYGNFMAFQVRPGGAPLQEYGIHYWIDKA